MTTEGLEIKRKTVLKFARGIKKDIKTNNEYVEELERGVYPSPLSLILTSTMANKADILLQTEPEKKTPRPPSKQTMEAILKTISEKMSALGMMTTDIESLQSSIATELGVN